MTSTEANEAGGKPTDIFDQPVRIVKAAGWLQLLAIVVALVGTVV